MIAKPTVVSSVSKWLVYWEFSRPFTLVMPAVGMLAGGLVAWGAEPRFSSTWLRSGPQVMLSLLTGALMAAVMNAGSNGLNQIFDLQIDLVNKPGRPLPSGRMTLGEARVFTAITFLAGLLLAAVVNWQCLALALAAGLLTACYSAPPFRTKRWGILANLTIAIPRGFLLPVAGWSTVKTIAVAEPWVLSVPLGLFILGANSTKDFSDIEGDRAGGCRTLPVMFGVRTTALLIAPFFVLPFLWWIPAAYLGWLSARREAIYALSVALPLFGARIDHMILRNPEELGRVENHASWRQIYLLAVFAYAGLAIAYLVPRG